MSQVNKPIGNTIQEMLKTRRMPGTIVEVVGERATVSLTGGSRLSDVRIVGGPLSAGASALVEWNGYEAVIYAAGTGEASAAVSPIRSSGGGGSQTPNRDPFTEAGWKIDAGDLSIFKDKTRIQPDGKIILGDGAVGKITLDAPGSKILIEDNGLQTIAIEAIGSRITVGSVSGERVILDGKDGDYRLWAGNDTPASAPFSVSKLGAIKATSGLIAGWTIGATQIKKTGVILDSANDSIYLGSGNPRLILDGANKIIQSSNYASGVSGFAIFGTAGDAEFNNVRVRGELAASVFAVDEIHANAGTFGAWKSAAKLHFDFITPAAYGNTVTVYADNSEANLSLLALNDIVQIKSWDGTAIRSNWFTVTNVGGITGNYTAYTFRLENGTGGVTFRAGAAIIDWGPSGTGFVSLSADGAIGASANLTIGNHEGAPWSTKYLRLRGGNLNGSYGYVTNTYGVALGLYHPSSASAYITIDDVNGVRIMRRNEGADVQYAHWNVNGDLMIGQNTAGQANVLISAGALKLRNATTNVITLLSSANAMGAIATFDGVIGISTNGGIYQGTGTFSSPTSGIKLYNSSGQAKLAVYSSGNQITSLDSSGLWLVGTTFGQYNGINWTSAVGGYTLGRASMYQAGLFAGRMKIELYRYDAGETAVATLKLSAPDVGVGGGALDWDGQGNFNSLFSSGDIYTYARTDYSGDLSVAGWSATGLTKHAGYKRIGKTVFFWFYIAGTSNNATTTLTLPFAVANTPPADLYLPVRIRDNGIYATGLARVQAGSTVTFYPSAGGGSFTASGTKEVGGFICYETS